MTRLQKLVSDSPEVDKIRSAEAEREPVKVTFPLSPMTQFIIEAAVQNSLHISRTAAVREVLDAAALDLLEAKGYTVDSEEFRDKYLKWLTQKPRLKMVPVNSDDPDSGIEEVEVYEVIAL